MKLPPVAILAALAASVSGAHAGLIFQFDYTYDTSGFFTDSRKAVLETAASFLEARIEDNLAAIPSSGPSGQSWKPTFNNPATGTQTQLTSYGVADQTMVIFVGARNIGGGTLAQATTATSVTQFDNATHSNATGNAWRTTVIGRGQAGVDIWPDYPAVNGNTSTDFGPWGGSISFSTAFTWYFDSNVTTLDVPGGQYDFFSVASHELGHLLGIGTASSWKRVVSGTTFTGAAATAANGGVAPVVESDVGHWAYNSQSTVPPGITPQEAALDPDIAAGTRKWFTDLDWAALSDIGWAVTPVPEPAETVLFTGLGLGAFIVIRRRQKAASRPA